MKQSQPHSSQNKYRPDIDGLRGIAILVVIVFHTFPTFLKGGFIGVDIFFVISGYLISGIILKSLVNNEFSYIDFYQKRIKRIFPALITVLVVCLIAGWFLLFSAEYLSLGQYIVAGAGFVPNIFLWLESGYFDISSSLKPLSHLWYLGVSEQFYLFWPFLLVFSYKKLKKVPQSILFFLIVSFSLNIFIGHRSPEAAFSLPITRSWELIAGALLAYVNLFHEGLTKKTLPNYLSITGTILLITSFLIINNENFYQGLVALPIISILLIIAAGKEAWINKKILSNKVLFFISLISYPLYLWHWPLLSFANIITSNSASLGLRLILVTISFLLAWATYQWIEKPIRFGKTKYMTIFLCLSLLLVGLAGLTVYLYRGYNARFPAQEAVLESVTLTDIKTKINLLKNDQILCEKMYPQKTANFQYCFTSGNGIKKIFIIGDSHTPAIYFGYAQSLVDLGYTVISRGISGCPGPNMHKDGFSKQNEDCNNDIKIVMESIISENPVGIIISNNYNNVRPDLFEKGMNEIISSFPKTIPLVWVLQTPRTKYSLLNCIDRPLQFKNNSENCKFPRIESETKIIIHNNIINSLKEKYSNLITVDPHQALCSSTECPITLNNQFLYEDDNFHLSTFGSHYLAEKMPITQYFPDVLYLKNKLYVTPY